ncbi:DELTA-sagatoxin-Srs1a-like [Dunckerocampus dactyliophorus]|uniref:DELTA-sagatoxin-Srs1a-like n=1 Tax=Dunckerocampus dactyliophorus TaxID=161453 RepID=UPI0024054E3A|nr:DELTA-sagatoxin-Srs1a-like [Dunckerocampus dactyliophorus]XP_054625418.1 DELTA-sagatoxin-Srs1a-like [Dunckerocampus dactyliophorus]
MTESAEALSANQKSRRNVTIEITNLTSQYCLMNPKVYLDSGNCHSPPQPTVRPLKTEVCNFTKSAAATSGTVGVLTYEIFEAHKSSPLEKLAIMFSVPFNYNLYKNWLGVGLYPTGRDTDEKLYKEMYYDKDQKSFVREEAKGCCVDFHDSKMDIKVTMSPMGRAIMKVEVWDNVFN